MNKACIKRKSKTYSVSKSTKTRLRTAESWKREMLKKKAEAKKIAKK